MAVTEQKGKQWFPAARSRSASDLDTDTRIVIRADSCGNVRQPGTENIQSRQSCLALVRAGIGFNHIRRNGPERPSVLKSQEVSNHSPGASHDSTRRKVARLNVGLRVDGADLIEEARDRTGVDVEEIGLTV